MNTKHETKYKQGLIQAKAQFPLPIKTKINLYALQQLIQTEPKFKVSNGNPTYLCISETILEKKNSFNVFENGKIVCWHNISPKAWHFYLDTFYYTYIINCLSDNP